METRDSFVGYLNGHPYHRVNETEAYVEVPPALIITDSHGDTWSLGALFVGDGWDMEFNVIRNDQDMCEFAKKIVYQGRKVKIYGKGGWRTWTGRAFI